MSHIQDAAQKGAQILCGGTASDLGKQFILPTILDDCTDDMLISCDETFGPVLPIFRFTDEKDVIQRANDTPYGLAAYFYTNDLHRMWRVGEALEYGIVSVNDGIFSTETAPFGGFKQSGIGREGSKYGIEEYLETKYMLVS